MVVVVVMVVGGDYRQNDEQRQQKIMKSKDRPHNDMMNMMGVGNVRIGAKEKVFEPPLREYVCVCVCVRERER